MRLLRLFKRDLARESATWVEQGLISEEQARSICAQYDIDYASAGEQASGYHLLTALGYLFIGLALITLIGANWDDIPRGLRMAGLLVTTLATHGLALRAYFAGKADSAAQLFLLGNFFYGASIILIAQIYHLGEHMPDGVFWWALGSLPFGVLLRHTILTLFSVLLALLWFFLEFGMGFYPAMFPVFIAAGLYVLMRGEYSAVLFLAVLFSIGLWVEATLALAWSGGLYRMEWQAEHLAVSVALFVFAYAFSQWLGARDSGRARDYSLLLSLWSLRFGLLVMLVLSFAGPWEDLIRANWDYQASMWPAVLGFMGMALYLAWRCGKLDRFMPMVACCLALIITVIVVEGREYAVYLQVLANIVLVAAGIRLILLGVNRGMSHYFFLGIAVILLTAFLRYVDLIGDYIGGAALFLVLAMLLLGAARYWRRQQAGEGAL